MGPAIPESKQDPDQQMYSSSSSPGMYPGPGPEAKEPSPFGGFKFDPADSPLPPEDQNFSGPPYRVIPSSNNCFFDCRTRALVSLPHSESSPYMMYLATMIAGGSCVVRQFLYFGGGSMFGPVLSNQAHCYCMSLVSKKVWATPPMRTPKFPIILLSLIDRYVYCLGFKTAPANQERTLLDSCERYDTSTRKWAHVPPMNFASDFTEAACTVVDQRYLYIPLEASNIRGGPGNGPSFAVLDTLDEDQGWKRLDRESDKPAYLSLMSCMTQYSPQELLVVTDTDRGTLSDVEGKIDFRSVTLTVVDRRTLRRRRRIDVLAGVGNYNYPFGQMHVLGGKIYFGLREDYDTGFCSYGKRIVELDRRSLQSVRRISINEDGKAAVEAL